MVTEYVCPLAPLIHEYTDALTQAGYKEEADDVLIDPHAGEPTIALGSAVWYAHKVNLTMPQDTLEITLDNLDDDDTYGREACLALLGRKDETSPCATKDE